MFGWPFGRPARPALSPWRGRGVRNGGLMPLPGRGRAKRRTHASAEAWAYVLSMPLGSSWLCVLRAPLKRARGLPLACLQVGTSVAWLLWVRLSRFLDEKPNLHAENDECRRPWNSPMPLSRHYVVAQNERTHKLRANRTSHP